MPDLGAVAYPGQPGIEWYKTVRTRVGSIIDLGCGQATCRLFQGASRANSEGNTAPSLCMDRPNEYSARLPVEGGVQTSISVQVKQGGGASLRPRLVVKAAPGLGLNSDQTATASAGSGWTTVGPISFTPSTDGVVEIRLVNRDVEPNNCYWDNFDITPGILASKVRGFSFWSNGAPILQLGISEAAGTENSFSFVI